MANNRLFIVDTETGERIMLAKSFGQGWATRQRAYLPEGATEWTEEAAEEWIARLDNWLDLRDFQASYGNTDDQPSRLRLVTENEIEFEIWVKKGEQG